jgi:hypothetical protein
MIVFQPVLHFDALERVEDHLDPYIKSFLRLLNPLWLYFDPGFHAVLNGYARAGAIHGHPVPAGANHPVISRGVR